MSGDIIWQQQQQHSLGSPRSRRSRSQMLAQPTSEAAAAAAANKHKLKPDNSDSFAGRQPTYSSSGPTMDSLEQTQDSEQAAAAGKHAGPMGIFFKVWSLVKVTKGRHQQRQQQRQLQHQLLIQNGQPQLQQQQQSSRFLRRQHSEDNSNYSADLPISGSGSGSRRNQVNTILQDQHFRRAGSQPAATDRLLLQINNNNNNRNSSAAAAAVVPNGGSCTSSGVSSTTSSTLAANSTSSPTTSSTSSTFQRRPLLEQKTQAAQESWVSRMKRNSARRLNAHNVVALEPKKAPLSLSLSTSEGSRSSSELRDEPEEEDSENSDSRDDDNDDEADEIDEQESANDIYSTPNDSIQSVPSGQRAYNPTAAAAASTGHGQPSYPITKSFSTNNFSAWQSFSSCGEQQQQKPARPALSGSRFFISSSSSEDSAQPQNKSSSSSKPIVTQSPSIPEDSPLTSGPINSVQRVQVDRGVHSHHHSVLVPVRPQSLLLHPADLQQTIVAQDSVLIPLMTPTGPTTTAAPSTNVYLANRSPSVVYQNNRWPWLEFSSSTNNNSNNTRFSSRYPPQVSSFQQQPFRVKAPPGGNQSRQSIDSNFSATKCCSTTNATSTMMQMMPNSISMFDFKQHNKSTKLELASEQSRECEYKLAELMLESGSNPNARDPQTGNTTLMLAVLSDNLSALKCLIEHGANLEAANARGQTVLDVICARQASSVQLEMLKLLIDQGVDLDRQQPDSGGRLLDRLIRESTTNELQPTNANPDNKMAFIEVLLESGAKLSSSTWSAARGKLEIQLCLLRKLCQDGYFLYKQTSTEAAVYRFEYALRRLAELEQQLAEQLHRRRKQSLHFLQRTSAQQVGLSPEEAALASRKIKYQTYLGLSRCERRRKFYKRALEFAQLAILVDSTSYEAFYSKAHILKDLGEIDDSLLTIDQTARLIEKSVELAQLELKFLDQQEESLIMDNCFDTRDSCRQQTNLLTRNRLDLQGNLEYLLEARKFVAKLRQDILDTKFSQQQSAS